MHLFRTTTVVAALAFAASASAADFASRLGFHFDVAQPWAGTTLAYGPASESFRIGDTGNHVSFEAKPGQADLTQAAIDKLCADFLPAVQERMDSEVHMHACGRQVRNGMAYLAIEYTVRSEGLRVFHSQINMPDGRVLIIGGAADADHVDAVREMHVRVAEAATAAFARNEGGR
jgi:hypothetical protein